MCCGWTRIEYMIIINYSCQRENGKGAHTGKAGTGVACKHRHISCQNSTAMHISTEVFARPSLLTSPLSADMGLTVLCHRGKAAGTPAQLHGRPPFLFCNPRFNLLPPSPSLLRILAAFMLAFLKQRVPVKSETLDPKVK